MVPEEDQLWAGDGVGNTITVTPNQTFCSFGSGFDDLDRQFQGRGEFNYEAPQPPAPTQLQSTQPALQCTHPGTKVGNALQSFGTATQRAGGAIALTGAAVSIPVLALPPAEIGSLSVTGFGGIVAGVGTAASVAGSIINFIGTHDVAALAVDAASNLIGALGARNVGAGSTVRGVVIGETANEANAIANGCH